MFVLIECLDIKSLSYNDLFYYHTFRSDPNIELVFDVYLLPKKKDYESTKIIIFVDTTPTF